MGTQVVAAWSPLSCSCSHRLLSHRRGVRSCSLSCTGYSETNPREVSKSAAGKTKPPRWCGLVLAWPWTKAQDHVPDWTCTVQLGLDLSLQPGTRSETTHTLVPLVSRAVL